MRLLFAIPFLLIACLPQPVGATAWVLNIGADLAGHTEGYHLNCLDIFQQGCLDGISEPFSGRLSVRLSMLAFENTIHLAGSYGHNEQTVDDGGVVGHFFDNWGFTGTLNLVDGVMTGSDLNFVGAWQNCGYDGMDAPCTSLTSFGAAPTFNATFVQAYDGPGPLPEPTTWAMMLLGFGLVGGTMRSVRRRQRITRSHA